MNTKLLLDEAFGERFAKVQTIIKGRIKCVLSRVLDKVAILCCLDSLTADRCKLMSHLLTNEQIEEILNVCSKYKNMPRNSDVETSSYEEEYFEKADKHLSLIIILLLGKPEILNYAKCKTDSVTSVVKNFYCVMSEFIEKITAKFNVNYFDYRAYKKDLGQLHRRNLRHRSNIKDKEDTIHSIATSHVKTRTAKLYYLKHCQVRREEIKESIEKKEIQTITQSERQMATNYMESKARSIQLEEKAKQTVKQYHLLMEDHVEDEKRLRIKRYKMEVILTNWINKYDEEVGRLYLEYGALKKEYDKDKKMFDELKELFDCQTRVYTKLMEEKRLIDQARFDKGCVKLRRIFAGIKIQRWWRTLLRVKSRRKRRKKNGPRNSRVVDVFYS